MLGILSGLESVQSFWVVWLCLSASATCGLLNFGLDRHDFWQVCNKYESYESLKQFKSVHEIRGSRWVGWVALVFRCVAMLEPGPCKKGHKTERQKYVKVRSFYAKEVRIATLHIWFLKDCFASH